MKIVFKIIAIIGVLSFFGGLKNDVFFIFGLILAGIFGYFGWRPDKKVKPNSNDEQSHNSEDSLSKIEFEEFDNKKEVCNAKETTDSKLKERISLVNQKMELLSTSLDQDILTQQEFHDKKKVLEIEKENLTKSLIEINARKKVILENDDIFKNLLDLKTSGIITQEEYNFKEKQLIYSFREQQTNKSIIIKDIDENHYNTVQIDDQIWMTQNLSVNHFRNGDLIREAKSIEEWKYCAENKVPAWCFYQNNPENAKEYGKLYNWYAASDKRGIAPVGWRVSLIKDWDKIKENIKFIDRDLISSGKRLQSDGFVEIDSWGWYWTPEEFERDNKFGLNIYYTNIDNYISTSSKWHKETGMAIRCVKEEV